MNRVEFEAKVKRFHDLVLQQREATPIETRERTRLEREIGEAPFEYEEGKLRGKTMTFSDGSVTSEVFTVGEMLAELSRLPHDLDLVGITSDRDYRDGVSLQIIKDPDTLSVRVGDK